MFASPVNDGLFWHQEIFSPSLFCPMACWVPKSVVALILICQLKGLFSKNHHFHQNWKMQKKIGSSSYLFSRRSCAVCKESAKSETMMRHRRFNKFDYFEVNVILSIKYLWYFNIFSIRIFEYFCIRLKAVNFYLCMFGVSSTKSG